MYKKAFRQSMDFLRRKPKLIAGTIVAMLVIMIGEQQLSNILLDAEMQYADYGLAVIRMILESMLSTILVLFWHRDKKDAAPFSAVDIAKLFLTTLIMRVAVISCAATLILIPLAIWLFLRTDFFMNYYITGRSNGIFSCVGASFRGTKGYAKSYLGYIIRYLGFYFLIEVGLGVFYFVATVVHPVSDGFMLARDILDACFVSLFMPYRYIVKCGFYEENLKEASHG